MMNIELAEVVMLNVSDEALEMTAGVVQSTYQPTAVWYVC
jgi:hypothetical protein